MALPPDLFRIAVAQLNPIVGDIAGNLALARAARAEAARRGADIVLFTELFVSGHPPADLALKPAFLGACEAAADALAAETGDGGPGVVVGTPLARRTGVHNAVIVADGGRKLAERFKLDLADDGIFGQQRVFRPGPEMAGPVGFRGVRLGVAIGEDIWGDLGVCETLAESGASMLLVAGGSPYARGRIDIRHQVAIRQVIESGLPLVYASQFGGQDEFVFDGASFAIGADRSLAFQMAGFAEAVAVSTWERHGEHWVCADGPLETVPEGDEADYRALMLGLRDHVRKSGSADVVLGLSGDIDAALCAALAVDALGAARVRAVSMPYRDTTRASLADAEACARALGCRHDVVPIDDAVDGLRRALSGLSSAGSARAASEHLRARARGAILTAASGNGTTLVTPVNRSALSIGCGDMSGGFNPVRDLYGSQVRALARWRNGHLPAAALGPSGPVIPVDDEAPPAGLRDEVTDRDRLPSSPELDAVIECLIDKAMDVAAVVARGHDRATVARVEDLIHRAESMRRQAAPGIRLAPADLGRDRRYPIANRFRDRG